MEHEVDIVRCAGPDLARRMAPGEIGEVSGPPAPRVSAVTPDELLTAYDDQLRTDAEMARAREVIRDGPLLWAVFDHGGFVSYRDLGGLEGDDLDDLIERTVAHYRDDTEVSSFEWKSRGHDLPADLGERLVAHGLVAEPRRDGDDRRGIPARGRRAPRRTPSGPVVVRRIGSRAATLVGDLTRMLASPGRPSSAPVAGPSHRLLAGRARVRATRSSGSPRSAARSSAAGRLTPVAGTEFAGIWGGSTLPEFRGRGIYRALVAARARVGAGARRPPDPLRLHRHVAPDPRALRPAGRDDHDAVRLDPLTRRLLESPLKR